MAGYAQSKVPIDAKMVRTASGEVLGEEIKQTNYLWPAVAGLAVVTTFSGALYWFSQGGDYQ